MAMRDMILAHLKQAVPFAWHVGVELTALGDGEGVAQLAEALHRLNHVGTHHAGALFTLAEAASGAAMAGAFADVLMSVRPLAASAQIDYRKPARGLIAATAKTDVAPAVLLATLDEAGKVRFKVNVALTNEQSEQVASMEVDWHVSKPRPAA
jgi:acyl-coenzyme A thioesterase PaaI-like protein